MVSKRGILLGVLLFVFFLLVFRVNALSLGVKPSSYSIDFEPGLEKSFHFDFMTDSSDLEFTVLLIGDLEKYVTLSVDSFVGPSGVDINLKLPQNIETPGAHKLLVGATPLKKEGRGGLGLVPNVMGIIRIHVPYPGKYANIEFDVQDANAGEKVPYKLKIYSRGEENITTNSRIIVYDSRNESVRTYQLGIDEIPAVDFVEINSKFDTTNYGAGNYKAVAVVAYDGQEVKAEDNFKLGELRVEIVNYTKELEKNKINPFVIEVESVWNDKIDNLYAEVFVVGTDISFLTPSIELKPWQRAKLLGYFDTTGLEEGEEFQVKMVLHYGEETTEETAVLKFIKTTNYFLIISIIAGVIAVLAFVAWVVIKLKKLEKKSGKGKKK